MSLQSSPGPRKGKTLGDPVSVGVEHLVDRGRWKRDDPGINRALNFVSQCKSPFSERSLLFKVNGMYRTQCTGCMRIVSLPFRVVFIVLLCFHFYLSTRIWGVDCPFISAWKHDHLFFSYFKHGFTYSCSQHSNSSVFLTLLMLINV